MKKFIYKDIKKRAISFPLGGIGTGCINLFGNGAFGSFEVCNHPDKYPMNHSFFAIKAENNGKLIDARILQSENKFSNIDCENYKASITEDYPHFSPCDFISYFPFAEIIFSHEKFPATLKMTAFNPFIPLNDTDSGIPAAFFEFEVCNTSENPLNYTISGVLESPFLQSRNTAGCTENGAAYIHLDNSTPLLRHKAGNMCISTDARNISFQEYLSQDTHTNSMKMFWNDFTLADCFINKNYEDQTKPNCCGVLASHFSLLPGETKTIKFLISWYFPYSANYDYPIPRDNAETNEEYINKNCWRNYYAQYFESSTECCSYCFSRWDRLRDESFKFSQALLSSTLPESILDAVANNLCILKNPGCLRLDDGSFWIRECSNTKNNFTTNSYVHSWNYAYSLAYLFPSLERSMTKNQARYTMDDLGGISYRLLLPKERNIYKTKDEPINKVDVCADTQLGIIIKSYRNFKISGDVEELIENWYRLCKVIDYCFSEDNPYEWDTEKTGVMLLYSKNPYIQGLYLAALKASFKIATIVGDKKRAETYFELFNKGKNWTKDNLLNTECYCQENNFASLSGVLQADLSGLGEILDRKSVNDVIKALCHKKCTTGFEYQAAELMLMCGMVDEGVNVASETRKSCDGEHGNPFSEIEAADDYTRSLSSYALLCAISGFEYDAYKKHIGFSPLSDHCPLEFGGTFKCFFCVETGYGYVEEGIDYIEINMLYGSVDIRSFAVPRTPRMVQYGGRNWRFTDKGLCAELDTNLVVTPDKKLTILIDIKPQN